MGNFNWFLFSVVFVMFVVPSGIQTYLAWRQSQKNPDTFKFYTIDYGVHWCDKKGMLRSSRLTDELQNHYNRQGRAERYTKEEAKRIFEEYYRG